VIVVLTRFFLGDQLVALALRLVHAAGLQGGAAVSAELTANDDRMGSSASLPHAGQLGGAPLRTSASNRCPQPEQSNS